MALTNLAALGVISLALLGGACPDAPAADAGDGSPQAQTEMKKSLYERLGGEAAIKAVVEDFVGRAAADTKVNFFRKGVEGYKEWKPSPEEVAKLKSRLVDFIGMASGGPQKYTGKDMKTAHAGMKITSAEFDALAADLKASLDKFKVPEQEQKELLGAVAGTKKDMVSLYERLGGEAAIKAVVDDFVGRAAGDAKVNFFRKGVEGYPEWKPSAEEVATLKTRLVEFIGMASGGPQKYIGKDMKTAHAGMKITSAEFDALAADLKASLDKFKVPEPEQKELLGAVAGTKKDMVQ